jgi:hypothetical protein
MMMTTTSKQQIPTIILCALIRDGRDPPLLSFVDECFKCHRAVWRSEVSPRKPQAVCRFCVKELQREGTKMIEQKPNAKVRAALERYRKEQGTESSKRGGSN